jgi:hypothetical protein
LAFGVLVSCPCPLLSSSSSSTHFPGTARNERRLPAGSVLGGGPLAAKLAFAAGGAARPWHGNRTPRQRSENRRAQPSRGTANAHRRRTHPPPLYPPVGRRDHPLAPHPNLGTDAAVAGPEKKYDVTRSRENWSVVVRSPRGFDSINVWPSSKDVTHHCTVMCARRMVPLPGPSELPPVFLSTNAECRRERRTRIFGPKSSHGCQKKNHEGRHPPRHRAITPRSASCLTRLIATPSLPSPVLCIRARHTQFFFPSKIIVASGRILICLHGCVAFD